MNTFDSIPFAAHAHDRAARLRRDEKWLAEARLAASTRVVVVKSSSQLLEAAGLQLGHLTTADFPADAEMTFLGLDAAGRAVFVFDAGAEGASAPVSTQESFAELRILASSLAGQEAALAAQAVAMVGWHRRHRFCGVCGGQTVIEEAGHSRRCVSCGAQHFPRTDPAVIMLVAAGDRCVLSRRRGSRLPMWTALSGFVEPGETPEHAVVREVYEEVGVRVTSAVYRGSQPWPFPLSLMIAFDAEAEPGEIVVDEELEDARWFGRKELRQALADGSISLPPPMSVAHHLVRSWVDRES